MRLHIAINSLYKELTREEEQVEATRVLDAREGAANILATEPTRLDTYRTKNGLFMPNIFFSTTGNEDTRTFVKRLNGTDNETVAEKLFPGYAPNYRGLMILANRRPYATVKEGRFAGETADTLATICSGACAELANSTLKYLYGNVRFRCTSEEQDDVFNETYCWLLSAAATFKPGLKARFLSYVSPFFRRKILAIKQELGKVEFQGYEGCVDQHVDDKQANPFTTVLIEQLFTFIDTLPEREAEILRRRFGDNPETLQAIGDDFGVCRERISQIQKQGIKHLKNRINEYSTLTQDT